MLRSPCVRNCCLDQQDCCLGCGRLLTEITQWSTASEQQQQQILIAAKQRKEEREAKFKHLEANLFR